ncbi:MAG: GspE/PulE family protein [Planctomycetota bacterium]
MNVDAKQLLKTLYKMEEVDQPTGQAIYNTHRKQGVDIYQACLDHGIREDAVIYAVAELKGVEMVQLDGMILPEPLLAKVEPHVANSYGIIPVQMDGNALVVATADPDNVEALDDLKFMLGVEQIKPAFTSAAAIDRALERYYKVVEQDAEINDMLHNYAEQSIDDAGGSLDDYVIPDIEDLSAAGDIGAQAESAAVRKLLDLILLTAVKAQASDIHFEPFEEEFRVRNRIDGVLYEMLPVPKALAPALVARIKVMSHLDIAERRLPQDGKIGITIGGRSVDLRVSCLPTVFGESVVIRVLDRSVVSLDLDKIGMPDQALEYFRDIILRPNGVVVVTGPTGSGKTTTLYAALNEANDEGVKIITTEDPVEYEIDGVIQVQVEEEIGKTFASCLRSILRQDPDKILVGEVRDLETAKIAVESSLTGHIVFTTLHTNDAPTAVTRLLDMGIEPFLVAATLETIVAQRLVRSICTQCKAPYQPSEDELQLLGLTREQTAGQNFYYGKGCDVCKSTGYKGRTALFEIIDVDDGLRDLILQKASASQLRTAAQRSGMVSLREAGINKIFQGVTTIEEVVKETLNIND